MYDCKLVVPTPFSGIRVGKRILFFLFTQLESIRL
jgi:hypothetical protein